MMIIQKIYNDNKIFLDNTNMMIIQKYNNNKIFLLRTAFEHVLNGLFLNATHVTQLALCTLKHQTPLDITAIFCSYFIISQYLILIV